MYTCMYASLISRLFNIEKIRELETRLHVCCAAYYVLDDGSILGELF